MSENKTIVVSKKTHSTLVSMGRKDQTFDQILSQLFERLGMVETQTK
jgi:hypothetical protein